MTRPCPFEPTIYQEPINQQLRLKELLANWDRAAFGVAMRRIEVLLVRGFNTAAREVFEALMRRQAVSRPTLDSWVDEVYPQRIAYLLTKAGYMNLAAVRAASDEQLLGLPNLSKTTLNMIRQTVADVIACRPLPEIDDLSDLWPDWPYCVEYDEEIAEHKTASIIPFPIKPTETRMTNALTQAIETLLSADGAALQELDAKISALQQQVEQLRRVRKLIAPIAPKGKPASGNSGIIDGVPQGGRMSEVVDLVIDALETGPVHYRELSNLLDVDVRLLCRSIHRSERLHRDADGMVSLVDALALREVY